jgi:hypothetical protein
MGKVRVACRRINGISIRLTKLGWDDGTGDNVKPRVPDGLPVILAGPSSRLSGVNGTNRLDLDPGITEVDAGWIEQWLDQNKLNPFVVSGMIYVAGPVEEPAKAIPL